MNDVDLLLQRAKKGDDQALGSLLEMYRNYLNMLARLQIDPHLRKKLSSSDLVQETFLNAKRGLPGFRGRTERELMAWLRRIMANRLADAARCYGGGREKRLEQRIESAPGRRVRIAIDSTGRLVAIGDSVWTENWKSGTRPTGIRVFDISTGKKRELDDQQVSVSTLAFSPKPSNVVATGLFWRSAGATRYQVVALRVSGTLPARNGSNV